jgi:uncharacterized protein (DUF2164 family)
MKEKQFLKELGEKGYNIEDMTAKINLNYIVEDNGEVYFDFDELHRQARQIEEEIRDILE